MRIAVDFDGVINSYKSGWTSDLPDPPVDGAFKFLRTLLDAKHTVYIFSARLEHYGHFVTMHNWFVEWGFTDVGDLHLTYTKPIADVYIDDRAWRFEGVFPSITELAALQPWWKT